MSLQLSEDLNDVITAFYEHLKAHSMMKTKLKDNEKFINLLKLEITEARKSEKRAYTSLKKIQDNMDELQKVITNLVTVKEENEILTNEITSLKRLLENENKNFVSFQKKWSAEKESIIEKHKEELENMKKTSIAEVISLNQEINLIKEENAKKIAHLKREFKKQEDDSRHDFLTTVDEYEQKLSSMERDLIRKQTENKNLHAIANNEILSYNYPPDQRASIPQPLSIFKNTPFVRTPQWSTEFKELVEKNDKSEDYGLDESTAPELKTSYIEEQSNCTYNISEKTYAKDQSKSAFPTSQITYAQQQPKNIKKRKLYSRTDDTLSY